MQRAINDHQFPCFPIRVALLLLYNSIIIITIIIIIIIIIIMAVSHFWMLSYNKKQ